MEADAFDVSFCTAGPLSMLPIIVATMCLTASANGVWDMDRQRLSDEATSGIWQTSGWHPCTWSDLRYQVGIMPVWR
jgi:hypothetical protein